MPSAFCAIRFPLGFDRRTAGADRALTDYGWPVPVFPATPARGRRRGRRLVDRSDDECVHRRPVREPPGGHGALGDENPLALAAAEDVEGDQSLAGPGDLNLQERAARQTVDPLGGPDVPDDHCLQHHRSFSTGTPRARALSRASGVSTARGPSTSRCPAFAAAITARSVTAPFSTRRITGVTPAGPAGARVTGWPAGPPGLVPAPGPP